MIRTILARIVKFEQQLVQEGILSGIVVTTPRGKRLG